MLQEKRFAVGALTLNYVVDAVEGPPLILIHGVMNCWQGWLSAVPPLATRWRLYIPELRGHGRSGHVAGGYTIADYAADIITFLREVVGTPAVIVGHSLGGIIATAVAAAAPDQVTAVVLEDPPLAAFRGTPFEQRPERDSFVALRDLVAAGHSVAELTATSSP